MRQEVVSENAGRGFSGYLPDLPGCVAAGARVASVKAALAEVIPFDLEGLRKGGEPVPEAESVVEWVEVEGEESRAGAHRW